MSEASDCHDAMHGLVSGLGNALFVGMANGRAQHAQRQANIARCSSAASGARADVYAATAADLRERLADADDDICRLTAERDDFERRLRNLAMYVNDLRDAGKIAA